MNIPQVALCGDCRVAIPMAVTVRSIARHARTRIDYHIIAPDFSAMERSAIVAATNVAGGDSVKFLELRDDFSELHGGADASRAYYFRLALPQLLPDLPRILYLDSDLLVRGDIGELWEQVSGSPAMLQACPDQCRFINAKMLPVFPEYGLTVNDTYYNSGVLGMNMAACREGGMTQRVVAFLRKHGASCPLWDQGAINALYSREIDPLPPLWNVFASDAHPAAKVVHFCTFKKPFGAPTGFFTTEAWQLAAWQAAMKSNPYVQEYFTVLDETVYRGWRPKSVVGTLFQFLPVRFLQYVRERRLHRTGNA